MRKLLWHSNAGWAPTGYGQQTKLFLPRLAAHYDVACSAFYGLEGSRIKWGGIPVMPGLGAHVGGYGGAYLPSHASAHFEGDARGGLVVTLMDVWVLPVETMRRVNAACWVPVDHDPAPPAVLEFFAESGSIPIAMSRFGERMLEGLDPLYVPHGVDTTTFSPLDRDEVRDSFDVPRDAFVIGMVAANKGRPSRKGFQQALQAFRIFQRTHPDALLYLHTIMDPGHAQGEDIRALANALGIPRASLSIPDQYSMMFAPFPPEMMAMMYASMDVLLNPAMGEGFGIPVLEAQSVGVPAIVTDFSAMPEVCGAGWHVASRPQWTGQHSWQAVADVEHIVAALTEAYEMPAGDRRALSARARRHALRYDADTVLETFMLPALEEAWERFEARAPRALAAVAA